jgi:hypothetical protein
MSSTLLRCGTAIPYPDVLAVRAVVVHNASSSRNKFRESKHLCFPLPLT